MPGLIYIGEPMNGTADRDIIVDVPGGAGPNSTINGNDGDDLILGDGDHFWFNLVCRQQYSLATALDIDSGDLLVEQQQPRSSTRTGPHTSVYIEPGAGQQRLFRGHGRRQRDDRPPTSSFARQHRLVR